MKIILKEKIKKLGTIGDIVTVKAGYARNFLIPNDKALYATPDNIKLLEKHKDELIKLSNDNLLKAQNIASKLDGKSFMFIRSASETGSLYGSVTAKDIQESLSQGDFSVSFNQIHMEDSHLKSLGVHPVELELHHDVSVNILAVIARTEEDATNALAKHKARLAKAAAANEASSAEVLSETVTAEGKAEFNSNQSPE